MDTFSISSETNRKAANIVTESLPSSLAAPQGWRSEIISDFDEKNLELNSTNKEFHQNLQANSSSQTSLNKIIQENFPQTTTHLENIHQYFDKPPVIIHKKLPNNVVTYQQNVSLRYLRPPTPPPPGPLIIREVRPPPPAPRSPIKIRQRPPPPKTPPPLIFREKPPTPPEQIPAKLVEKVLPAPRALSPQLIVERFGAPPPKPPNVIFERWLPYKKPPPRQILLERAQPLKIPEKDQDLLILYDSPQRRVCREFINQGVVRADPEDYIAQYGPELNYRQSEYRSLLDEATQAAPPPPVSPVDYEYSRDHHYDFYNRYRRVRYLEPDYYDYDYPSSSRYWRWRDLDYYPPCRYTDYPTRRYWNRPSRYCDPCRSYYPMPIETIRVRSEDEFRRVICDLTDGRFEPTRCAY